MKRIGLLGGMSWESTLQYYRLLNRGINHKMGGLHSADIIMHSIDFGPVEKCMQQGNWQEIEKILGSAVISLERGGADFFLICTNTMHKLAPQLEDRVNIPLLHIADASAEQLKKNSVAKVGLLGTQFTMEENFYTGRLQDKHGLQVLIPGKRDREIVNRVIFDELCCGKVRDTSRQQYYRIISQLKDNGAEAILLGCTEIGLLLDQQDIELKLFDTTHIHAAKAVEYALA